MTADDLRQMIAWLRDQVDLADRTEVAVVFERPREKEMLEARLHPDGVRQLLAAPWLEEMITEVRETPEFCDPSDPPRQVLEFARDVVTEYISKRFDL